MTTDETHERGTRARTWHRVGLVASAIAVFGTLALAQGPGNPLDALAARVDPYVEKTRVFVLTDIANEPDDQMSLVRFLVYSNEYDVEGLVATTSTWLREEPRPDVIRTLIDAYEEVRPNLLLHAESFPPAERLREVVRIGQPTYGMAAVGPDKMSAGAELLLKAAARPDERPLWVTVWGGANTLAQALLYARETMSAERLDTLVSKLRVYTVSDQDDAGPWSICLAPALRRVTTQLDAWGRLVPRPRQLEGHRRGGRRRILHLRSRHDLALAGGLPARLRGAHGLDREARRRRQPQPAADAQRPPGPGAGDPRGPCG